MNKRMDGSVQVLRPQAIPIPQREVYRKSSHGSGARGSGDPWVAPRQQDPLQSGAKEGLERVPSAQQLAGLQGSVGGSSISTPTTPHVDVFPSSSSLARCQRHSVRRIFVQTETGEVVVVEVDCASGGAEKVKRSVQAALNVPTEQADLIFGGHVLENLHDLQNDVPVLLKRGMTRSASSPCLTPSSVPTFPSTAPYASPAPGSYFPPFSASVASERDPASSPFGGSSRAQSPSSPLFEVVGGLRPPSQLQSLMEQAVRGVGAGTEPLAAVGGMGGAYYFRNPDGEKVVIVKPTDEEPFAPNNPNGYVGRALGQPGLKKAIRVGEAGLREVAAFLLDHEGFAGVPCTALVRAAHPVFHLNPSGAGSVPGSVVRSGSASLSASSGVGREILQAQLLSSSFRSASASKRGLGGDASSSPPALFPSKLCSLQQYVRHDYDASECGTSRFPVSAVHRIGILDVRIFNTDRHSGNILVRRLGQDLFERRHVNPVLRVDEAVELTPIDHGFCLPETLDAAYFEWLHWPQASLPFSEDELEYISSLDVHAEVVMLRERLPMLREGCLRVLVLSTLLLQRGAAAGLSLSDLGSIMSREVRGAEEVASELETLCLEAMREVEGGESVSAEAESADLVSEWEGSGEECGVSVSSELEEEVTGIMSPTGPEPEEEGASWNVLDHHGRGTFPIQTALSLRRSCASPPLPEEEVFEEEIVFGFDDEGSDKGCEEREEARAGPPVPEGRAFPLSAWKDPGSLKDLVRSPQLQPGRSLLGRPPRGSRVAVRLDFNDGGISGSMDSSSNSRSVGGLSSSLRASALSNALRNSRSGLETPTPSPLGPADLTSPRPLPHAKHALGSPTRRGMPSRQESLLWKRFSRQGGAPSGQLQQGQGGSSLQAGHQQQQLAGRLAGLKLGSAGVVGSRLKMLMASPTAEEGIDGALPGGGSFLLSDMAEATWERFYAVYVDLLEGLVRRKAAERSTRAEFFGTSCQW